MPLKVLVNGAGIGGPAVAALLLRSNPRHQITIVERAADLRASGQQIDLRNQGIALVRKLGLLDSVRARVVHESGMALYNAAGVRRAFLPTNTSGKGAQTFSSEYEIMRGDMVQILYDESLTVDRAARALREPGEPGGLEYCYNKHATALDQDGSSVSVTFSDGTTDRFDLVIGADGLHSRTRRLMFGVEASAKAVRQDGEFMALFRAPRLPDDDDVAKAILLPRHRAVLMRTGDRSEAQAALMLPSSLFDEAARRSMRWPVNEQKAFWAGFFAPDKDKHLVGRLLGVLDAADDFYVYSGGATVVQDSWHSGRVVLIGDAASCPGGGMGTTAALAQAYVLAGELQRHADASGDGTIDIAGALDAYEAVLRPFLTDIQKPAPVGIPDWLTDGEWGIWCLECICSWLSWLRVPQLIVSLMPTEQTGGWKVPDYPELNLPAVEEKKK